MEHAIDAPNTMPRLTLCQATSPMLSNRQAVRQQSDVMEPTARSTVSQESHRLANSRGPVSQYWLERPLLPRLSRRPYSEHLYFQQRMAIGSGSEEFPASEPPLPQPGCSGVSGPVPLLLACREIGSGLSERAPAKEMSTTLQIYRERLAALVFPGLNKAHSPEAPVVKLGSCP